MASPAVTIATAGWVQVIAAPGSGPAAVAAAAAQPPGSLALAIGAAQLAHWAPSSSFMFVAMGDKACNAFGGCWTSARELRRVTQSGDHNVQYIPTPRASCDAYSTRCGIRPDLLCCKVDCPPVGYFPGATSTGQLMGCNPVTGKWELANQCTAGT